MPKHHIKISFDDPITPAVAVARVLQVIGDGRLSKNRAGIDHFCWLTTFTDGTEVHTKDRKSESGADSFVVRKAGLNTP